VFAPSASHACRSCQPRRSSESAVLIAAFWAVGEAADTRLPAQHDFRASTARAPICGSMQPAASSLQGDRNGSPAARVGPGSKHCVDPQHPPSGPEAKFSLVNPSRSLPVVVDHEMEPHQATMKRHPKGPWIRIVSRRILLTPVPGRCQLSTPVGPPDGQLLAERKASQSLPAPEVPILESDRPSPLR